MDALWWAMLGGLIGFVGGLWVGFKAFVAQRYHVWNHLDDLDRNIDELAQQMPSGLVAPDAVHGWIASIRVCFLPQRKWMR